ncbi:MAG: TIGR03000 domain-containing protein [Candidatus Sulfotelmatobacter sp.]
MRKMLLVLSLAGLTVLASASDAFAQYGVFGLRSRPLVSIDMGGGNYYSPFGYYGGPGPYYRGYGYGYAPSYYDGMPAYSNDPQPAPLVPRTQIRQSYYPAAVQDFVNVTVLLPAADAQVWFENKLTTQRGMERLYESPPLAPNHSHTYTIKARWMENGKAVDQERQVNVRAGQNITVNFREKAREEVPAPTSRVPTTGPQK